LFLKREKWEDDNMKKEMSKQVKGGDKDKVREDKIEKEEPYEG